MKKDWEMVKLDDVCEVVGGTTPHTNNPDYWNGNVVWLSPTDLPGVGIISEINNSKRKITQTALKETGLRLLPIDSLVFSTRASIGKIGIVKQPLTTNQGFTNFIPGKKIDVRYLAYVLKNNIERIEKLGNSTTFNEVSRTSIKNYQIPLPPLPIQKKIADILDKADALRRADKELLNKYDQLAQAIFIDMFGDPVKNEKGWEVKTIEQLVKRDKHSIKRGPFGGALKKEIFVDEGYLVYEQYHALNNDFTFKRYFIDKSKYEELIAFDVKPGDIIISCAGIYLGKLAIVPSKALPGIINQALLKITLDNRIYNSDFFVKIFTQKNFKEKYFASERGAAIPNFPPMSAFKDFKFIAPPIKIQNVFLNAIRNIEEQKQQIYKSSLGERLFGSLIQKSFKGELV